MAGWVSPSRLISLYEIATLLTMDQFRASTFYLVGRIVEKLASKHGLMWRLGEAFYAEPATVPTIDEKISQKYRETISMVLPNITDECRKIGLERATLYAEHVLQQLTDRGDLTNRQIGSLLIELDKHITIGGIWRRKRLCTFPLIVRRTITIKNCFLLNQSPAFLVLQRKSY